MRKDIKRPAWAAGWLVLGTGPTVAEFSQTISVYFRISSRPLPAESVAGYVILILDKGRKEIKVFQGKMFKYKHSVKNG